MVKHARRPLYLNLLGNPKPEPDAVRLGWRVFLTRDPTGEAVTRSARVYQKNVFPRRFISSVRLQEFERLLKALPPSKKIFVVRMPVSGPMKKMEAEFWPEFEERMQEILSKHHGARFLSYISASGQYEMADAHHLHRDGAIEFTRRLASDLAPGVSNTDR
jgi:hypothetical protein